MLEKAATRGADMVLIDLEDAVAPNQKESARTQAVAAINNADWGNTVVCVRTNAFHSSWVRDDIAYLVENASQRLDELMIPKIDAAGEVAEVERLIADAEWRAERTDRLGLEIQIESVQGFTAVKEICLGSNRLEALVFGPADFSASLGIPALPGNPARAHLPFVLTQMLIAARSVGIQVIDGPSFVLHDEQALRQDAQLSVDLGFDGKWAIHPEQVPILNELYTPSPELVSRAQAIVRAYESATDDGAGATDLDGEMLDEASAKAAQVVLARAARF